MLKIREAAKNHAPLTDSDLPVYTVELPSRGIFYPGGKSSVEVTPLLVSQARQMMAANAASHPGAREKQLANIIGRSLPGFNVFDLTVGDYGFLAQWLKLNSYKKSPYTVEWEYPTTDEGGNEVKKRVLSVVKSTDLRVIECEKHLTPELGYERVRDRVETLMLEDESDREIAPYASVLEGKDIAEKIAKLDKMEAEYLMDIRRHQVRCYHGIEEHILLRDTEVADGPSFPHKLVFNIKDFFP